MKLLIDQDKLKTVRAREGIPVECLNCKEPFLAPLSYVIDVLRGPENTKRRLNFCSYKCKDTSRTLKVTVKCLQCGKLFVKMQKEIRRAKKPFCSLSCNAKYGNAHKTFGYITSKPEQYLLSLIKDAFPRTRILRNNRRMLSGLELDIVIPKAKVAIEVNGITHYKPIYGAEQFLKSTLRDRLKRRQCKSLGYQLLVINIAQYGYQPRVEQYLKRIFLRKIKPTLYRILYPQTPKLAISE